MERRSPAVARITLVFGEWLTESQGDIRRSKREQILGGGGGEKGRKFWDQARNFEEPVRQRPRSSRGGAQGRIPDPNEEVFLY